MEKATKSKVMNVTNHEYDSYNRVIKSVRTDENNKLIGSCEYVYNNDGLLLYKIESSVGVPYAMITFAYNDSKQLKLETKNAIGIPNKKMVCDAPKITKYKYDINGNLKYIRCYDLTLRKELATSDASIKSITEFIYNSNNKLIVKIYNKYDDEEEASKTMTTVYEYDANNRLINEITSKKSGQVVYNTHYEYNDKDQMMSMTHVDEDEIIFNKIEYTYDEAGRKIRETQYAMMYVDDEPILQPVTRHNRNNNRGWANNSSDRSRYTDIKTRRPLFDDTIEDDCKLIRDNDLTDDDINVPIIPLIE